MDICQRKEFHDHFKGYRFNINAVKGFPPKVIWIQKGNCSTKEIIHLIKDNYLKIKRFNGNNEKGIFILR